MSPCFQTRLKRPLLCHLKTRFSIHLMHISTTVKPKAKSQNIVSFSFSSNQTPSYYALFLQCCLNQKALVPGKQLHACLCHLGLGFDEFLATKLVNLYCICNCLREAHLLFDKIPKRNLFLWNILIQGYAWYGPHGVAIELYYRMFDYGLVPDNFTFPFVLKACSTVSAIEDGRKIHGQVIRSGWEGDVFVGAALIDMYAKCGLVDNAREVFDKIAVRDVVLWNSMLAAYSQNDKPDKSISLCSEMVLSGLRPSEATLVTVISASAAIGLLPQGKELHGFAWRWRFESNDKVKTTLLDMYAKCGSLKVAHNLFDQLKEKRVVSWNAMITGYAMHGRTNEALELFDKMREVAKPDHITFVGVLSACSHDCLLEKGRYFFESMVRDYHIEPAIQHYTCMIDLLGHSGRLVEAYHLIMQMRMVPDAGIWGALLNSCKIHGNVEFGELALEKLIEFEPDDAGNYAILSNIYAQAGRWDGVAKLRKLMTDKGLKKSID